MTDTPAITAPQREAVLSGAAGALARETDRHRQLVITAGAAASLAGPARTGAAVLTGTGQSFGVVAAVGTLQTASGAILDATGLPAGLRAALVLGQSAQWPAGPSALGLRAEPGPHREAITLVPIPAGEREVAGLLLVHGWSRSLTSAQSALEALAAQLGLALRASGAGAWMEALVDRTPELVFLLEPDATVRFANAAAESALGWEPGGLVGVPLAQLLDGPDVEPVLELLGDLVRGRAKEGSADLTLSHRRSGGVHVEAAILSLLRTPTVRGLLVTATDVRERRSLEARLSHSAGHDPITNLPNRPSLVRRLSDLGLQGKPFCVLHVAVPEAAPVDGQRRLIENGERLRRCLPSWATLGRSEGEGFLVVVERSAEDPAVASLGDRILTALSDPLTSRTGARGLGIGFTAARPDRTAETLLYEAQLAAEAARRNGGRGCVRFDPSMEAAAEEAAALRRGLAGAVQRSEFVLHYQPIVAAATGRLTGFEALLRWHHPELGLLAPGRFIGEAEDSGLIVPIGFWALEESCRALARFQAVDPSLSMSVNLSARQLEEDGALGRVSAALAGAGILPATLCLEITESLLVHPASAEAARINRLAELGVRLAIDDFGTGFSSLGYLRTMPVHTVKIDRSFVSGVGEGGSRQALVASIISLCQALDLGTVAEGVETEAERAFMATAGCDRLQGYLFARPLPEAEAMALLCADEGPSVRGTSAR